MSAVARRSSSYGPAGCLIAVAGLLSQDIRIKAGQVGNLKEISRDNQQTP